MPARVLAVDVCLCLYVCVCACLSVCLSVTRRYCIEMVKLRMMQTAPHSPRTKVSDTDEIPMGSSRRGHQMQMGRLKSATLDKNALYLENCKKIGHGAVWSSDQFYIFMPPKISPEWLKL